MPGTMPVASGGIHAGEMKRSWAPWARTWCCISARTIGHPMGIAAGATANRVAVEAMIKARNEGRDYGDGANPPGRGAKACPPLQTAIDTWGDITFNYEST